MSFKPFGGVCPFPRPRFSNQGLERINILYSSTVIMKRVVMPITTPHSQARSQRQSSKMEAKVKEMERTDGRLIEYPRVEYRDVDSKRDTRTPKNDGPEQYFVRPQIHVKRYPRSNGKHTPIERLELPSEEQNLQDECSENCRTCSENVDAVTIEVGAVALGSQVAVIMPPHDHNERDHDGNAHKETVAKDVDYYLDSENTLLDVVRWSFHNPGCWRLHTQTKSGRARRDHVDPKNGQWRQRKYTPPSRIDESETQD